MKLGRGTRRRGDAENEVGMAMRHRNDSVQWLSAAPRLRVNLFLV
jgi:hypothetical protein